MRNPELIDQLSRNLEAVKPLSPWKNTIIWIGVSLLSVFLVLAVMSHRPISQILGQPMALISTLWFFASSVFLAFAANVLGMPGRKNQRLVLTISFVLYLLLVGVLMGAAINHGGSISWSGGECVGVTVILCVLPMAFFYSVVRKLAPTSPLQMGLVLGLATCALGAFGIAFSCPDSDPLHLLVFHLLAPAALLGGLGAYIGKKWFRW